MIVWTSFQVSVELARKKNLCYSLISFQGYFPPGIVLVTPLRRYPEYFRLNTVRTTTAQAQTKKYLYVSIVDDACMIEYMPSVRTKWECAKQFIPARQVHLLVSIIWGAAIFNQPFSSQVRNIECTQGWLLRCIVIIYHRLHRSLIFRVSHVNRTFLLWSESAIQN